MSSHVRQATAVDLGIDGFIPLPGLERPGAWEAIFSATNDKPFLLSEGMAPIPGPPQVADPRWAVRFQDVVTRFDRFYRSVVR